MESSPPKPPASKKQKPNDTIDLRIERALKELEALDFKFTLPDKSIAEKYASGIKPSRYLIGTVEEEEKYAPTRAQHKLQNFHESSEDEAEESDTVDMGFGYEKEDEENDDIAQQTGISGRTRLARKTEASSSREDASEMDDYEEDIEFSDTGSDSRPGQGWFLVNGAPVTAERYLGPQWTKYIEALYAVPPMEIPDYMAIHPHEYQLKCAAQAHFSCESKFKGFICGDSMGLGKTLMAILAMYKVKDEPGMSLVAAPKGLCKRWVAEINGAWIEGHAMKAMEVTSSISAHELQALGLDVAVCSYELIESGRRAMARFPHEVANYVAERAAGLPEASLRAIKPKRPTCCLNSLFWKMLNLPFKRLVLDEVQVVNKRSGARHRALKDLHYKAVIMLSGTLAHNKWHNMSGYVDFISSHPFPDHRSFLKAFSAYRVQESISQLDICGMRLLQRFLQAFTIARPSSMLRLRSINMLQASFNLSDTVAEHIKQHTAEYKRFVHSADKSSVLNETIQDSRSLAAAVRAQILSLHPLLYVTRSQFIEQAAMNHDVVKDVQSQDFLHALLETDEATRVSESRTEWLDQLTQYKTLKEESNRLCRFLMVYRRLRKTNPEEKIVVFSAYLRWLDIIAELLHREHNITALRFDSTVSQMQRVAIQEEFKTSDPSIPLLITAGAGGYGLNLTTASIVIQTEIWWNINVERQAIARVWRQRQEREVQYVLLFAENSAIDQELRRVQTEKDRINSTLMEPLIRKPGQGPLILPLTEPVSLENKDVGNRER